MTETISRGAANQAGDRIDTRLRRRQLQALFEAIEREQAKRGNL